METAFPELTYPPLDFDVSEPRLLVVRFLGRESVAHLLGLDHFNDPSDPRWPLFLAAYDLYNTPLAQTAGISATEGGYYASQHESGLRAYPALNGADLWGITTPEEALRNGGEQAAHRYLSILDGHTWETTEPPAWDEVTGMLERFSVAHTSYFYYMRYARQYVEALQAGVSLPNYDIYVKSRPSQMERRLLGLLDFSPDSLSRTHKELYPDTPFDPSKPLRDGFYRTAEYYKLMYFPFGQGKTWDDLTLTERMAFHCNGLRDSHHLELVDGWLEGGSNNTAIFDTHGPCHNLVLEPALRAMPGMRVESYIGWSACSQLLGLDEPSPYSQTAKPPLTVSSLRPNYNEPSAT